jgi:hypothetical protein
LNILYPTQVFSLFFFLLLFYSQHAEVELCVGGSVDSGADIGRIVGAVVDVGIEIKVELSVVEVGFGVERFIVGVLVSGVAVVIEASEFKSIGDSEGLDSTAGCSIGVSGIDSGAAVTGAAVACPIGASTIRWFISEVAVEDDAVFELLTSVRIGVGEKV